MKDLVTYAALAALVLALSAGCASRSNPQAGGAHGEAMEQEGPEGGEEDEEEVPYASLPAAVRAAAERHLAGATDFTAEREIEGGPGGVPHYEVVGKKGERHVTVTLSGAGELVELETEIGRSELPAEARAALDAKYPGVTYRIIERVEPVYFEVKFRSGGKWHEVQVHPSGLFKEE